MSRPRTNVLLLALAASCGGAVQMAFDGDVGDGAAEADARPEVVTDFACSSTHTTSHQYSSGVRHEYDTSFAVLDVGIADDFWVELCDPIVTTNPPSADCPAGDVCTEGGAPFPPGQICFRSNDGQFRGGRLYVQCGSGTRRFSATGTLDYSSTSGYGIRRLHVR